jgi:ketosteroid isomerase-like protein
MPTPEESVVLAFIGRINAHDAEGIVALCAPDHTFIDSLGNSLAGQAALLDAWRGYFQLFPDYRVEVSAILSADPLVAAFGTASATLASSSGLPRASWSIPAAWRAVVESGRLVVWQVYADNKPVYEILAGAGT